MTQPKPDIRLYVPQPLVAGERLTLGQGQSHYLAQVMRRKAGDSIAVFNGHDGEWLASVEYVAKKSVTLEVSRLLRLQKRSPDLWLAFAPIKGKTELVAEKAVELGASALLPVFTRHAVVKSINQEKLEAHAIEAAEQCERMDVPRIEAFKDLPALLAHWPEDRILFYGDESGGGTTLRLLLSSLPHGPFGLLIGPEGGFSAEEHRMLKSTPFVKPFGMGPRILRADTAAVAALACLQCWLGDWEEKPACAPMESHA
ncbi:MAG: 16S rRNA (uracil(1498)-N(3))-methyltransferase [Pseudomonadota bacterium]|nr:16S rRNA (uracil(1498)-N(3))-methyltransferase [Pseudomonadota bacterium]